MMTFLNDAIVFVGCEIPSGTQGRPRLMQLSLSGELICLSDADICYGATVGSDLRFGVGTTFAALDDQIYCIATEDERSVLKCFSKKKGWRNLCDALCTVDMFAISRKRILLTGIAPLRGAEIYELSEDDVHCCSNFRKELTGTSARPMSITVNGCEVRGFVMPPREIQPGRQYAAVLCIHGGPHMAFGAAENHDHRLFSKMGCFVVFCNPFGSDGRGYQFYEHNGVWGGEMEQHIAFLREACSRYPIDPERVAIFGGSYGGYMANCMIACKHSFRAAIVERGVSYLPWQEMLGDLPAAYKDKQFQRSGLPYPESFRGCSPLMTADTTTTPTLFIQADADRRCPMIHGQAMFRRLCANNVPARMIVFHGDNHGLNRTAKPWKRIHRWYEMEQWLWRYLLAE